MTRLSQPLHQRLSTALVHDEFEVNYQPLVDLSSGEIAGAEALIRWRHHDGTYAMPGAFIPQCEKTGFIITLDQWVLKNACAQAAAWRRKFAANFTVAVNLSAHQFSHPLLISVVRDALRQCGLDAAGLELEVTESAAMHDADQSERAIEELRALGVRLSLDDFGTGYSSLSYLHRFPFHKLKIDRSFIGDFSGKARGSAIVGAIVALAQALDMRVVAEGIERVDQLTFLRSVRCDVGQGFWFGQAVPAPQFERLLEAGHNYYAQMTAAEA